MPSTTGWPSSVVASATAANTAGQARPTRTSGTSAASWVEPSTPTTPAWSATRSGSHTTSTVARPSSTDGVMPAAAVAVSERIAVAAASVVMTGTAPVAACVADVEAQREHVTVARERHGQDCGASRPGR